MGDECAVDVNPAHPLATGVRDRFGKTYGTLLWVKVREGAVVLDEIHALYVPGTPAPIASVWHFRSAPATPPKLPVYVLAVTNTILASPRFRAHAIFVRRFVIWLHASVSPGAAGACGPWGPVNPCGPGSPCAPWDPVGPGDLRRKRCASTGGRCVNIPISSRRWRRISMPWVLRGPQRPIALSFTLLRVQSKTCKMVSWFRSVPSDFKAL
jgi:hypothetical protein